MYGRRRPWKALLFGERALRNPPAYWALNVRTVVVGTRESRLGPDRLRGGGKRCLAYNRRTREVAWVVERQSERVVVLRGRESRLHGEGPVLHRCTGRMGRTLMSAVSARSVSRALGVDRVRALQRVLYRCAKQDQDRRFHALYDKVAVQPVTASIQRVGVPSWEGFDCPGSDIRRAWGVTPGRGSPEVKAPDGPVACGGRVSWLRGASNPRGRSVKRTLQRRYVMPPRAPVWECSMPTVEFESAEPLTTWRRPVPVGKGSDVCTRGALRRRGGGTEGRTDDSKRGRSLAQPRPDRMAKTRRITAGAGSRWEGWRLAAEAV